MRDLDVKTLRLFVAVCECRTMARVAEQEHIEPSAISKRIAQLEDDLGVELLMRGRRGVQPTPAGLALLDHARTVLFTMNRIAGDAAAFSGGIQGHVRLIATASAIADALLDDIAAFMREPANRNIKVDIEERFSRDLVRQLKEGSASLGVCWDSVDFDGLRQRPYRRDRLALAVHAGHPLAERTTLRFEETLDAEHVGLPPQTAVHAMLQRAAAKAGRSIAYRVIVSNFDAALRVVAANLGVSVVPLEFGRRSAAGLDIRMVPISDPWAERNFAICFRQYETLPAASQRLVAHLQERAQQAGAR
ncbi:MAG TPA: LysR family transcriptional regulator [Caldimonas sp.]